MVLFSADVGDYTSCESTNRKKSTCLVIRDPTWRGEDKRTRKGILTIPSREMKFVDYEINLCRCDECLDWIEVRDSSFLEELCKLNEVVSRDHRLG